MTVFKADLSDTRIYYAKNRAIPFKATVKIIKFMPRRKCVVEYLGITYVTLSTLLRKIKA